MQRKFGIVGVGERAEVYIELLRKLGGEVVALCDKNQQRMDRQLKKFPVAQTYSADNFQKMLDERQFSTLLVTSPDFAHEEHVVGSLQQDCDVFVEKPLVITLEACQRVGDALKSSGADLRVCFNSRFSEPRNKVRELIQEGAIGLVTAINASYFSNLPNGGDFYKTWQRESDKSGGLLLQKSVHHFDLINWWIASFPIRVSASGSLKFYGKNNIAGNKSGNSRCLGCGLEDKCNSYTDVRIGRKGRVHFSTQKKEGEQYVRDRCAFGDGISIYDTMSVWAEFENGAVMNYLFTTYNRDERFEVAFVGTRGMIKYSEPVRVYEKRWGRWRYATPKEPISISLYPFPPDKAQSFGYKIRKRGHQIEDKKVAEKLISGSFQELPGYKEGIYSVLPGIGANISIAQGNVPVDLRSLIKIQES